MKALMYHYVRPHVPNLPFLRHLHIEDFRRQLDVLRDQFGFVGRDEFLASLTTGEPPDGVILTFDDGLKDHVRHVLPELERRGLWGIFYISTGPLRTARFLDVHRTHLLLGHVGGSAIASELHSILEPALLRFEHIDEFRRDTYRDQDNDDSTLWVKRVLNYYVDVGGREQLLDQLMTTVFGHEHADAVDFYLNEADLRALRDSGMLLGSHTENHPVLSTLTVDRQRTEIETSFALLEGLVGEQSVRTFCYPYGGFHTFTRQTEQMLTKLGCSFSFNVESRDVSSHDLLTRPQALPRYDCNEFEHGACRPIPASVAL